MKTKDTIDKYRLERLIGEGGMGEVWLAQHQLLDRKVAIKSLHPQLVRNDSIRTRFKNEAATLARLDHPHIVKLYDYIEQESGLYLVLEYVEGQDLSDFILKASGPIVEPRLTQLFSQVLSAFSYAHQQQIVHRDIKPSNFLITRDDQIKVLDFGIAKILDADHTHTKTGTRMGTVLYMSPEQVKGEPIDQRSDIYSLGVTLFQMATGQVPYDAETTEFQVYNQIVNSPLPPMKLIYPGVPDYLQGIVQKATAKNPQDRFQTVDEFTAAFTGKSILGIQSTKIDPNKTQVVREPVPVPEVLSSQTEEPPIEVATVRPSNEEAAPQTIEKKRTGFWVALVGGIVALAIIIIIALGGRKAEDDRLYIIASSLTIRTEPSEEAKGPIELPYGEPVEVVKEVNPDWVEIEYHGQPGFLARRYLVPVKLFQEYDCLGKTREARNDILHGSYHKIALHEYFNKQDFHFDLPDDLYEEKYEVEKQSRDIWEVDGLGSEKEFNAGVPYVKLERGKLGKNERKNSAFIIQNKADPDQRRLVFFRHLKSGSNIDIGSVDISDYPDFLIHKISLKEYKEENYSALNYSDRIDIYQELNKGKEGILLGKEGTSESLYLVIWKSMNKLGFYPIQKSSYFY